MMLKVLLLCLLLHWSSAHSTKYTVGDSKGWTYNISGWENGKCFKSGDTLVFKYAAAYHNVVVVDKSSYDSCILPSKAKTYNSGNDKLRLTKGPNYFICGIHGHCQAGMKIAANAA
ncbi:early nodulin-like protein [Striga asiatica]|uniref:Basic blue protein n=1 Tax=Striga asiatica TaxID=4170 RepID=A0A5A7RHB0_STRAF|nr:early nodulin-like protein [Striga asiatica]